MNKKLRILLLSSLSPNQSANLGLDVMTSLEQAGHDVDFITRYKFDNMLSNMYSVYDYYEPIPRVPLKVRLKRKFPFLRYLKPILFFRKPNKYLITNKIERKPPVDSQLIINKMQGKYDVVITLFWQDMTTAMTLKYIYDKLQCPIFIYAVDMFPMTGGCFYFWDCRGFLSSCGNCPGLYSNNKKDQTNKNFLLKKDIYSSIQYVYIGNSWMTNWAKKSLLFQPSFVKKGGLVISENTFLNIKKEDARNRLTSIPKKKFIMFAGASSINSFRKGFEILVKSVNDFSARLSEEERNEVLLLLAGKNPKEIQEYFQLDVYDMGYLHIDELALAYAAADVYLSTTVQDAGPSMVNQALMCGTPVVAFEIGVALDIVLTGVTGYRAKYRDITDYCIGIQYIYNLTHHEKTLMYEKCREIALQESSFSSFSNRIEQIYEQYIPDRHL